MAVDAQHVINDTFLNRANFRSYRGELRESFKNFEVNGWKSCCKPQVVGVKVLRR